MEDMQKAAIWRENDRLLTPTYDRLSFIDLMQVCLSSKRGLLMRNRQIAASRSVRDDAIVSAPQIQRHRSRRYLLHGGGANDCVQSIGCVRSCCEVPLEQLCVGYSYEQLEKCILEMRPFADIVKQQPTVRIPVNDEPMESKFNIHPHNADKQMLPHTKSYQHTMSA